MENLYNVLRYLDIVAFVLLGAVTYRQWRTRRDKPSRWAALTFASLGIVALAGEFIPEDSDSTVVQILQTALISVLVLFPYFLFRLASSFSEDRTRNTDLGAGFLTALVVFWAVALHRFPDEGEPQSTGFKLFLGLLLAQWVLLSTFVAIRFWRAGADQPDIARRRMRTLAGAATAMSVAIVLAGTASGERSLEVEIAVQVIAMASVIAFYLALSPPGWLRWLWRRDAEKEIRRASAGLMAAGTRQEIVDTVLPRAAAIVGGRGIAMFNTELELLGSYGFSEEELASLDPPDENPLGKGTLKLEYPFGCLVIGTTLHTPFFGEEDINLLGALGTFSNLAMQRLDAAETERHLAEAQLRRRQALEINDNVVQRLAVAHYSFELGRIEEGKKAMEAALGAARRTISDLLDQLPPEQQIDSSTLTRQTPATE